MATILDLAKDAAERLSFNTPDSLFPTFDEGDSSPAKLRQALSMTCNGLRSDPWQIMRAEHVIACTPTEVQVDAIPVDFVKFIPGTFYDRTRVGRMIGPLSADEWQRLQIMPSGGAVSSWAMRGNNVHLWPVPENGRVLAFEYQSKGIGWNVDRDPNPGWSNGPPADAPTWGNGPPSGVPARKRIVRFVADTNATLWDDELVTLGIVARYLHIMQTPDALADAAFFNMRMMLLEQDGGRQVIDMDGCDDTPDINSRAAAMRTVTYQPL